MDVRFWVYKALVETVKNKVYSNLYLKDHLQELPLKDQALASKIYYGTLQNWDFCQAQWKRFAEKKTALKTGVLLSMSVYQLLFLSRIPSYAVLNDANRIASAYFPESRGMVNAVLRKVLQNKPWLPEDPFAAGALRYSIPEWLLRMWAAQYGPQAAMKAAAASVQTLPVYGRINPLNTSLEEVESRDDFLLQPDGMVTSEKTHLAQDDWYKEGKLSIQDPGSYEIARFVQVQPGMQVLDVCAAPGSKTMAMAEMMQNEGAVTACDIHDHRLKLIEQDATRLGIDIVSTRKQDSSDFEDEKKWDRILCDVPCSGYGVLARKPDMKLSLDSRDMDTLIPLQKKILEQSAQYVKPQGKLVYSTCTLNKKENEKQVESFLKDHPEFELEEQKTLMPNGLHDGFYMARLVRLDDEKREVEALLPSD